MERRQKWQEAHRTHCSDDDQHHSNSVDDDVVEGGSLLLEEEVDNGNLIGARVSLNARFDAVATTYNCYNCNQLHAYWYHRAAAS